MKTISRRSLAGHDAGRIHNVRAMDPDGRFVTQCGLTIGRYGVVEHDLGPTCTQCKRLAGLYR